eukprot:CAMPEP_0175155198 /NCGR_PEP_ID=MMETSP0087-20121206/20831_1 /TAXON_ID=136419 /ORGANISM="Unknown Unknown, Strain D1" /LENGTH=339 /DNA_ID=CAMNT_0016442305 /DNA_START=50 /DNA_END=1069 /DNA_ORIENTATION=+
MNLLYFWLPTLAVGFPNIPSVQLNNGVMMPVMLWGSGGPTQENSTSTATAVATALSVGFPGIDTANHYHNQDGVAQGIAAAKTGRKVWITTKVEPCGHSIITPILEGNCFNGTLSAHAQNLQQLKVKVVDLTLIHSPPCKLNSSWADPLCYWPDQPDAIYPQHCNCAAAEPCAMMQQQWRALEQVYKAGQTRAIGVSNFCKACLECIAEIAEVAPAVNQLQFHVGMPGPDPAGLISYTKAHNDTVVQAYSPLAGDQHAKLLDNPTVTSIAQVHNKTTAQVALRWVLQLGSPLATSTTNKQYMVEDLQACSGWELTSEEMGTLNALKIAPDDPVKSMCLL